jgi:predicted nucleotide-binding protein (sugar kinase/HSP70/actin superfamily)
VGAIRQFFGDGYAGVLAECRQIVDEVEVDFTRPKALCKITGEFWAQTTEGDGNCRLFSFLEDRGAEVVVEPVTTWIVYLLDSAVQKRRAERAVRRAGGLVRRIGLKFVTMKEAAVLRFACFWLRREYERMRGALGGLPRPLPDMAELRALARPFFNDRISGGEGHMEVGKTAHCAVNGLAHLVLSVKPFGCLPSTQSDGVQGASLTHYGRLGHHVLFASVETAGEGSLGFHSRVQMLLEEAQALCATEYQASLEASGCTLDEVRAFCAERRDLRRPFQRIVSRQGTPVGRAARFVLALTSRANGTWVCRLSACPEEGVRPSAGIETEMERASI